MAGAFHMSRGCRGNQVAVEIPRALVLTGHFPPEPGGVQTFTWELVRLPPTTGRADTGTAWGSRS
ncbi:hypothetical protein SAMN04489712_11435 [Thermomonospora echinospora]|uniref:Uncharacterized protein n=1 Tax=Thermomonospora echinospora TaxID=1992 RepID=A0A1H6D9Z5_9ACTN|nr:hypothetical protein [Thermomonospora echinospora]SEG81356.1 hypothetical protein SAMN04489712_11435 [Thermomonospora echinospora]